MCRRLARQPGVRVVNVDKLTYAGHLSNVAAIADSPQYRFCKQDICDFSAMVSILRDEDVDGILHLAAESHVDRSIEGAAEFIRTNVNGTFAMLEAAREHWQQLDSERKHRFRFVHVSTDEVYGALMPGDPPFREDTAYDPSSPYSASKAAADHLASAWHRTYGLPVIITNCSNNYGPYHFPEKLIPLIIVNALEGKPLPIYGKGENIRDWLFVEDHAEALELVLGSGRPGATYNIGGNAERRNIDVVKTICATLDELQPRAQGTSYAELIHFVTDRPGHDFRYAVDTNLIARELGWQASRTFETGIRETVEWYLSNEAWWGPLRNKIYSGERLGLNTAPARQSVTV